MTVWRNVFVAILVLLALPAGAGAAFPGQNGKIAYDRYDAETDETFICAITPGGSPQCPFPGTSSAIAPTWSASGTRLAFVGGGIHIVNSDGSGATAITSDFDDNPAWSPDGGRLVFTRRICPLNCNPGEIYAVDVDGTDESQLTSDPADDDLPAWSPNGFRIAWEREGSIWTMRSDGSGKENLGSGSAPNWSPDGMKLAFAQGGIWTMNADGTGRSQLTTGSDHVPAWSPDGTKIAFRRLDFSDSTESIRTVDVSTLTVTPVVIESGFLAVIERPDWQPLPVNTPSTYARPKGATPIYIPLVPAHQACTSPNRQHAQTLNYGSCSPPVHLSPTLTVGVGDGSPAFSRSVGSVRLKALLGVPGGPDDSDMAITLSITNVMRKADLSDYTGEVGVDLDLQLTDQEGPVSQTTQKFSLSATAPCTATASTIDGATCSVDTTAEALIPAAITEGARAIFELGPIRIRDGGPDEDADTPAGDGVLARQGVFVP